MIRVYNWSLPLRVNSVKKFENLSADQLVLTINNHDDLLICAVFRNCIVNICHLICSFDVLMQNSLFNAYFFVIKILPYILGSFVTWSIVHNYHMIVRIVLHKNRLQIVVKLMIIYILKRSNQNTNRRFFILTDFIFVL